MPKIGETLYMYSGLRTKYSELITNKEKLISIQNVKVLIKRDVVRSISKNDTYNYFANGVSSALGIKITVDRRPLSLEEVKQFVIYDGFTDVFDFADYWLRDEKGKKINRIGATMDQYHWTDLKY